MRMLKRYVDSLGSSSSEFEVNIETAAEQRETGKRHWIFQQISGFGRVGALILGGLGVGGAIRAHVRRCF